MPLTSIAFAILIAASFQSSDPWRDTSPHRIRFVDVGRGVKLEVLDWGGTGAPVVFLAGLGNSAHEFDHFAPRLATRFHVYGITRRGYGASSQATAGYDIGTLARDIEVVLDTLHIARASLVGHSMAGNEMTKFAATYPDRVEKLVYYDAAYDRMLLNDVYRGAPPSPETSRPTAADSASPAALHAYLVRAFGANIPEADIRATTLFTHSGHLIGDRAPARVQSAIFAGNQHPAYAHVRAPALAFYAVSDTTTAGYRWNGKAKDREKARQADAYMERVWKGPERKKFGREVRGAQVVEILNANHHIFISNERQVLQKTIGFLLDP